MKKSVWLTGLLVSLLVSFGIIPSAVLTKGEAIDKGNSVKVYGPGGPFGPIDELATRFTKETGIKVEVTSGPEEKWLDQAKEDADIIYGGSEYMLTNFTLSYPNIIDEKTRTELYTRPAGILVRKGNPKNIQSLDDLTKKGIQIIDVNGAGQLGLWEDLAGRKGLIPDISKNIGISVKTSAKAIELWNKNSKYDAWITYESWHYRLKDTTDLIQLPERDKLYRGTPISMTRRTENKKEARLFINYLKTEKSHQIFQKWGWK